MKKIAVVLWAISLTLTAFADGGTVVVQKEERSLKVTILAQPMPLQTGFTDISVLVQNAMSGQPVLDADVRLSLKKIDSPSAADSSTTAYCEATGAGENISLTRTQSHNKMLYTSQLSIPEPGPWEITARVVSSGNNISLALPLDIAPAQKPAAIWWPLLVMVPVGIGLYAWRATLVRARHVRRK